MAVIAAKSPRIKVTVVDLSEPQIRAWNSDVLPIYEPGLDELVKAVRGRYYFIYACLYLQWRPYSPPCVQKFIFLH